MSYPRVNLLKKSERRYQGAVSRRFMLVSIVVTPILFIAILSGVKLIQYGGVKADLKSSEEIWDALEPRLAAARSQQKGLNTNRQVIELIRGWQSTRISMEALMLDIQEAIPENVQLTRVSIRSELKTSVYREIDELKLVYKLSLQGVSQGEQAETSVIRLRRDLLKKEHLSDIFGSIKLSSMRKREKVGGEKMREFSFEGLAAGNEEEL